MGTLGESGAAPDPESKFKNDVLPQLEQSCGLCHGEARAAMYDPYGFMALDGGDEYLTITTYGTNADGTGGLIDYLNPRQSRILTHGAHTGPALTTEQASDVGEWLDLEAEKFNGVPEDRVETAVTTIFDGANTIPLDGAGATGASISFTKTNVSAGWYLTNITLESGPGTRINHPQFTLVEPNGNRTPDEWDQFAGIFYDVMPGINVLLSGGTLAFQEVPPNSKMLITFVEAFPDCDLCTDGTGDQTVGGCQDVPSFVANVAPIMNNNCLGAGCHIEAPASDVMDLSNLEAALGAMNQAQLDTICRGVLSVTNAQNIANSSIVITTDPNDNAVHPFKFGGDAGAHTAFVNAVTQWITDEANSQMP